MPDVCSQRPDQNEAHAAESSINREAPVPTDPTPGDEQRQTPPIVNRSPNPDCYRGSPNPPADAPPQSPRSVIPGMGDAPGPDLSSLVQQLTAIREELLTVADGWRPWSEGRKSDRDASARNLLQYLALRGHDLRGLQDRLVMLGLSSLGGTEGHVQSSVDAVLSALCAIADDHAELPPRAAPTGFARSREVLANRTAALLGPVPRRRPTRIMVTMPSEAASNAELVRALLKAGMDCMRVNCAHDSALEWHAMHDNLRRAENQTGRHARLVVDLPGPKLRTGPLPPQPTHDHKGAYLRLRIGDRLRLTRAAEPAASPHAESRPAQITCSLPEAFAATRRGHHVWLDDGKLGGVVQAADRDAIELLITSAGPKGAKLRADKGINLPDAELDIDLLGAHSTDALQFAAECADLVGLSFVSRAHEVPASQRLSRRTRPPGYRDHPQDRDAAGIREPAGDASRCARRRARGGRDDRPW